MTQTFHLEVLGFAQTGKATPVVQRQSLRADNLESVERRAVRLLQRSRAPHWAHAPVEAVRIVDGAGSELFRWSLWDEISNPGQR